MLIATWNVNSLRVRMPHLKDWLAANPVDVIALQETKLDDPDFPREEIESLGLKVAFSGQRTYNGVALLAKHELDDVVHESVEAHRIAGEEIGRMKAWGNHPLSKAEHLMSSPTMMNDLPQTFMEPLLFKTACSRGVTTGGN